MRHVRALTALLLALGATMVLGKVAMAHQPYFEDEDFTPTAPYRVANPTVSTAVYATLTTPEDVDYFTFDVEAGQAILFGMSIPDIEGQAAFNPTIVVMGPGLAATDIPGGVEIPDGAGAVVLRDTRAEAPVFFEPFSRTRYWDRQEATLTLPESGTYMAAVLHEDGATGRYTFVIGQREVLGGDPLFMLKMRDFWTPYVAGEGHDHVHGDAEHGTTDHADGAHHDHAAGNGADHLADGHDDHHGPTDDRPAGYQHSPYDKLRELLRKFWEFLADQMPRT